MVQAPSPTPASGLPAFARDLYAPPGRLSAIGSGFVGGKAAGLLGARRILDAAFPEGEHLEVRVDVPALAVVATDVFDTFLARNDFSDVLDDPETPDERIAHAFQRGDFPPEVLGDLRSLALQAKTPLAVRSSSLLEDATHEPFAGVYTTKMIPNHEPSPDARFRRLVEALKLVYASCFFREARGYRAMAHRTAGEERMAAIVQEVVGLRHQDRFYPTISGVGRTWNWYPSGPARPEQGVVSLALGLGRQIVEGGRCWTYCPAHPQVDPPLTIRDLLQQTQTSFWSVNMGAVREYDPTTETEFLLESDLAAAGMDGSLEFVASTYDAPNDRIVMGIGRKGPRIVNLAPQLKMPGNPLNDVIRAVLDACERETGEDVEIEFAITLDPLKREQPRLGLLQVRPIVVSREVVELRREDLVAEDVLVGSDRVLGNGVRDGIGDVVYVKPEAFTKERTRQIAGEVAAVNRKLAAEGRKCVLVVFGRIGSTDPWLGIPVDWGQITQAGAIVEATTPEMNVDLSQGSHFFHNVTNLEIPFFTVKHEGPHRIRWDRLANLTAETETEYVRHVRLPVLVRVDGRHGLGLIRIP